MIGLWSKNIEIVATAREERREVGARKQTLYAIVGPTIVCAHVSRDAQASGSEWSEHGYVCRTSTRELALFGFHFIRVARNTTKKPHGAFASVIQPTYCHHAVSR
jgi:hypothetical protein